MNGIFEFYAAVILVWLAAYLIILANTPFVVFVALALCMIAWGFVQIEIMQSPTG